ncbi:murein hydrolase activator EnvC family protein [Halostreptopolyspora alba]|uniref:M23 family peptidase n=1 Tax=Halostreptopolyspora alba TaxID=2487137 RepID=A0A3N0EAA7_9ACTN|nr:M23 family peptidase [Nocardiopsaceae bacterium YIM 96095]
MDSASPRYQGPRLLAVLTVLFVVPLAVATGATPARTDGSPWRWPLAGEPRIIRDFAPPEQRWLPGHRGVDLAAEPGERVLAAGRGRVAFVGRVAGTPAVTIRHGELRTTYLPVRSGIERGERVGSGAPIGTVATAPRHCDARSCLHWGLIRGRTYLDPQTLLGRGEIRLLPVADTPRIGQRPGQARGWARV